MRWIKHLTAANRDEDLDKVLSKFGPAGYGIYWLILETIGQQMDETDCTSATYSMKSWAMFCRTSTKKLRTLCDFLAEVQLISVEYNGSELKIDCPNLLKYRDEWTKRAQRTPEKLRRHSGVTPEQDREVEVDTEVDTNNNNTIVHQQVDVVVPGKAAPTYPPAFLAFWSAYPKKVGKGAAVKAWKRIKGQAENLPKILEAIQRHKVSEQWRKDNGQFIPHPATWLNQTRWEDEIITGGRPIESDYDRVKRTIAG